ncbi:hypothetical protein N7520_007420 [Penicillium odoratum]|uniref:uncharacterized protein n=1 Tax=Penicillium odoratum TaxID=1167516 RepID=UPI002547DEE5|nr:uncharacterized protein N7520_007420 [Penicillium odoratum]KAJ5760264.1 hypothetical protein N7520_007420 [Penicillium odoratum]
MALYSRYGYSYENAWDETTELTYKHFPQSYQKLFFSNFAFDCLTFLALTSFLVWACAIRPSNQILKGVIAALVMWMVTQLTDIIYEILVLASAVVKQYYVIDFILEDLFEVIFSCILFLVFYQIIHELLDRLTDSGKPYAPLRVIHWIVVSILAILSLAEFAVYVVFEYEIVEDTLTLSFYNDWRKLYGVRCLIYFIVAFEIFAWTVFVAVKGKHRFGSRTPLFALLLGSLSWFGYSLMLGVVTIRYYLMPSTYAYIDEPEYLGVITSVFAFVFVIGIFTGVLLCLMNWFKLAGGQISAPLSTSVHYPPAQYPPTQYRPAQYPYETQVFQTEQPHEQNAQQSYYQAKPVSRL